MTENQPSSGQNATPLKRAKRVDRTPKIVVRLTEKEMFRLRQEAGSATLSTYVRNRLFEGPVRRRDLYVKIAALHEAGRELQALLSKPTTSGVILKKALNALRAAILALSKRVPAAESEDGGDG